MGMFARQLLQTAQEVEAAEGAIKAELRRAAQAGENARVIDILTRWETVPAVEVLKSDQTPQQRLIDVGESR
jgi:heme-degrading monooxygenase HmoA